MFIDRTWQDLRHGWRVFAKNPGVTAIAVVGGLGGLAVGYGGIVLLRHLEFPTDVIAPPVFELDRRSLIFSLVLAMASVFLLGLGPAIQTTRGISRLP